MNCVSWIKRHFTSFCISIKYVLSTANKDFFRNMFKIIIDFYFLYLQLQYFKQHLQKSKEGSKQCDVKQRSSPVPGNHSALSLTAPPALSSQIKTILISAGHIPRQNMNRYQRNSVEGLNTVSIIGPILDDRLKEKFLKSWEGVLCFLCVCLYICWLQSTPFDLGT